MRNKQCLISYLSLLLPLIKLLYSTYCLLFFSLAKFDLCTSDTRIIMYTTGGRTCRRTYLLYFFTRKQTRKESMPHCLRYCLLQRRNSHFSSFALTQYTLYLQKTKNQFTLHLIVFSFSHF